MTKKLYDKDLIKEIIEWRKKNACNNDGYMKIIRTLSAKALAENYDCVAYIVDLYQENGRFALRYAFGRGIYAGFEFYFKNESPDNPFEAYVLRDVYFSIDGYKNNEYYDNMRKIRDESLQLGKKLSGKQRENVLDLISAWRRRTDRTFKDSFFQGCRYAFKVILAMYPHDINKMLVWLAKLGKKLGYDI